jgi:hypothetical protein
MDASHLARLDEYLWPKGFRRDIWMILDAARDRRIFSLLLECHLVYSCLYSGALHPEIELAAPYLVQLEYENPATHKLIRNSWGQSWGVFLRCDASLERLRRHLRHFLLVSGPTGERLLFRYYDPRVLRVYLPTCTIEELRTVYGSIECFWTEDERSENFLEFRFDQHLLDVRQHSFS